MSSVRRGGAARRPVGRDCAIARVAAVGPCRAPALRPRLRLSRSCYPFYVDILPGAFPSVSTAVVMLVFTMMALGLNIVVGYAGLLDLGYVAFYAVGAYTAGWFASLHFEQTRSTRLRSASGRTLRASTSPSGSSSRSPGCSRPRGDPDRPADAAAAGRLPGDRHARIRRDHPAVRPQRGQHRRLQPHQRDVRINPIDSPGFGSGSTTGRAARSYQQSANRVELYLLDGRSVLVLFTIFCSIRLRDSRLGRAWIAIREDETAAAAMGVPLMRTKTLVVRDRRVLRGRRGRVLRELQERRLPGGLLLQHLRLPALHGHPRRDGLRVGRARRRAVADVARPGGAGEARQLVQRHPRPRSTCRSTTSASTASSSC